MSFPHVILREAIAFQVLTIVLVVLALFWDAPLEQLANPLLTPNPAKAPWYFLGLQELLHYFPPLVAGVLLPTLVVLALVVIPYFDVNIEGEPLWAHRSRAAVADLCGCLRWYFLFCSPSTTPGPCWFPPLLVGALGLIPYFHPTGDSRFQKFLGSRPLPWWVMTWFIAVALTLTAVGTFFRGPGWSWVWPWR